MNLLTAARRIAGRLGGRKGRGEAKVREGLQPRPQYSLSTPESLLDSLAGDQRAGLGRLFNTTRWNAQRFCDVVMSDGSVIADTVNRLGQPVALQILLAKRNLNRLDLPEEILPRVEEFLTEFVNDGMSGKWHAQNYARRSA